MVGTDHIGHLGHVETGAGADHVGAVLPDPAPLLRLAHHIAGGTLEEENGNPRVSAADHPFGRLAGRLDIDHPAGIRGDHPDGDPLEPHLPADDGLPAGESVFRLVFMEIAVVGEALEGVADVDVLIGVDRGGAHHLPEIESGFAGFPALDAELLRRLEFHHRPELLDPFLLRPDQMVAPAGMLRVDIGPAQVLHRNRLADRGFHHRRTGQKGIGQLLDHDRFGGEVDDVGAARGVPAGGEGVLLDPLGRHPAHVVEHRPEMAVVGEAADLERQVDAAGIGDVDAGKAALLGDRLGPHVLLQRDREIGARGVAVLVGEDHAVLPVDDADAGDDAAARDVAPLLLLVNRSAVEPFLADVIPGVEPQFEEFRSRIDQHPDQFPHRLLPLLGKPLRLRRAADVVRLLTMPDQERVLLLPVFQIRLPFLLLPLRPAQPLLCFLRHRIPSFCRRIGCRMAFSDSPVKTLSSQYFPLLFALTHMGHPIYIYAARMCLKGSRTSILMPYRDWSTALAK